MKRVKEILELNSVKFQSGSGIFVDLSCFTILEFDFCSIIVENEGMKMRYAQKEAVRIGSAVEPVPAELFGLHRS